MALNRFCIIGRLTRPPILKTATNDQFVATLSIAVNRRNRQGKRLSGEADLIRVTARGEQADIAAKCLNTGSSIYIEGRLETDAEVPEGGEGYALGLIAEHIEYLSVIRPPPWQEEAASNVIDAADYRKRRQADDTGT